MNADKKVLAQDIEWFVKHIGSRKSMLPTFAHVAGYHTRVVNEKLDKFIDQHAYDKVLDEDGRLLRYAVPEDYSGSHRILFTSLQHSRIFADLLPKMTLVSLVSLFDAYLARLFRIVLKLKPEILTGSEKYLTFAQLSEFESLDAAKEYMLEAEVESVLRESHSAHFDWLEKRLGIPLRKDLPAWVEFMEITERRNLLVHADGVVNKQYITICENNKCPDAKLVKIGDRLGADPEYYEKACDCIAEIGVKLGYVIWSKLLPKDQEAADISAIQTTYDFLIRSEYKLAEMLARFCTAGPIRQSCIENSLYLKVNLAIAIRGQDRVEDSKALIRSTDWSALSDKFKMASKVLLEEYDEAADIMRKLKGSKEFGKKDYRDWPLFRWFRRTDQFKSAYQDVFGEPFKIVQEKSATDEGNQGEGQVGPVET